MQPEPADAADWPAARAILQQLAAWLAEDDLRASNLYHEQLPRIAPFLGAVAQPLHLQMEQFHFDLALDTVQSVLNHQEPSP